MTRSARRRFKGNSTARLKDDHNRGRLSPEHNKENSRRRSRDKALLDDEISCATETSPVSVTFAHDSSNRTVRLGVPHVRMGETGAEVTLDHYDEEASSLSSLRHVSGLISLLDEATPSPKKRGVNASASPEKIMGRTCSLLSVSLGSHMQHQSPDTPLGLLTCGALDCCSSSSRADFQCRINQFLESPNHADNWCHGWQAYFQVKDNVSLQNDDVASRETVRRILRHRVTDLAARRDRLAELRRDLSPFDMDRPVEMHRTQSMQHSKTRMIRTTTNANPEMWACGTFDFSKVKHSLPPTQEEGYDSEPELTFPSRRLPAARRAINHVSSLPDINDDDAVQAAVQDFMNTTRTLIWHCGRPCSVSAWLERGQHLNARAIGPRLVWRKTQQTQECHSIDLLDIHRILPAVDLDRKRFPFARAKRCLWIHSIKNKVLLEASSEEEREYLVSRLKLTVSRLAMKIITSDPSMADEFFLHFAQNYRGPGEEPDLKMGIPV